MTEPVAQVMGHVGHVTIYEDSEYVRVPDAYCSEHGNIAHDDVAAAQCDHTPAVESTTPAEDFPIIESKVLVDLLVNDPNALSELIEHETVVEGVLRDQTDDLLREVAARNIYD